MNNTCAAAAGSSGFLRIATNLNKKRYKTWWSSTSSSLPSKSLGVRSNSVGTSTSSAKVPIMVVPIVVQVVVHIYSGANGGLCTLDFIASGDVGCQ